ncbi:M23 family metallopeptidase [Chryseobacterium aahli]|uniref:M23 family metallopeptidase n=1 Tax=Chryseobacterium aahli TaxID=1278643 RepID=UPI001F60FF5C|nr:M23 family metallopeptidase [Chryseobacterium aahli]MCI3936153.1 M23 family metallopeptidase [Chryseobacterium aahli]
MNFKKILFLILVFLGFYFTKAQEFPKEQLNQYTLNHSVNYGNDTLSIKITNSLSAPLRVNFVFPILSDQKIVTDKLQFTISENFIFEKKIFAPDLQTSQISFTYDWAFGDDNKTIKQNNLALPFPKGNQYTVMQSNNGSFSHNDNYSRYAIDFDMKVGDTITSADDGYVVGVIKDYQFGGNDIKWTPYANYITIYHPHSGLFTQYVHLKQDGSFVKVGDMVKRNQPIGLSGETGYVSGAHLHFNVLVPEKNKTLISVPFSFENNLDAKSLKRNMKVRK